MNPTGGPRWEKHGNASLGVTIQNGTAVMVEGTGLTTEEAVEAVCSYLPVVPVWESEWRARAERAEAALERAREQLEKYDHKGPKQIGRALVTIDKALAAVQPEAPCPHIAGIHYPYDRTCPDCKPDPREGR